ncbi:hypothetical protein SEENP079_12262 [Salmonella enterica subsp. enterica serovar Newport str. RI_10P079]|nr:hypothetical protein SEENP079_12262 [Salmonella enterica subsp. enterica serovar Newport str. RI_10P079]
MYFGRSAAQKRVCGDSDNQKEALCNAVWAMGRISR